MSSIIEVMEEVAAAADQPSQESREKVNDIDITIQGASASCNGNEKQNSTNTSTSLPANDVDDDSMKVDKPETRKRRRVPKPSLKQKQPPPSVVQESKVVETPQELYEQIKNSRDKLFFIAYPNDKYKSKKKSASTTVKNNNKEREYQWCLVRVDLSSCKRAGDETEQCQSTGKYYVEFYMKASYDQGILLTGNKLENGISSAKMMKPKADNESRYWLEFHEYHINKAGEMEVGKWKEFQPNTPKAIIQRLMDLVQQKRQDKFNSQDDASGSDNTNVESDGEERLIQEYHPNFDKYTTWADVLDLFDTTTRLVGPFDFDDSIPPPMEEKDLKMLSEECKKVFSANQSKLHVKDRVPLKRWEELLEVVKDRDIDPPSIVVESEKKKPKRKKQITGSKRPREESEKGQVKQSTKNSIGKKARKETNKEKELLNFPTTSSRTSLSIRSSDRGNKVVSKDKASEDISSIVQEAFAKTRQATSDDGKTYFVLSELKDTLSKALKSWTGGKEVNCESPSVLKASKKLPEAQAKAPSEPLGGLHESDFAANVVDSLPVAYAYEVDDPAGISEENAKIAQLDYEVEERRLRRSNMQSAKKKEDKNKEKATAGSTKSKSPRVRKSTVTDIPAGWSIKAIKRSGDTNHIDRYWEHPDLPQGLRVRSKVGVQTLVDYAEANNCGISKAYEKYKDVTKFWTKTRGEK